MTTREFEKLSNKKCGIGKKKQAISVLPIPIKSDAKSFTIPIRLVSACNARAHWRIIAKRKAYQRFVAERETLYWTRQKTGWYNHPYRYKVTITRIGKRKMDSDNLAGSAKYVRDGIADALGIDDGSDRLTWVYAQEIGVNYGVRVEIK